MEDQTHGRFMDPGIASAIASSNRTTLWVSAGILVVIGLILAASFNYFYNALFGPFAMRAEQLLTTPETKDQRQVYVQAQGDTVFDSGLTRVSQQVDKNTNKVSGETTIGYYHLLLIQNKLLVVYSSEPMPNVHHVGALSPLSASLRSQLMETMGEGEDDWFLPLMLDTSPYTLNAYLGLSVMIPVGILALFNLVLGITRSLDPSKHPLFRAAEAERKWLAEKAGTEYGNLTFPCDRCGYHKNRTQSTYRSNVSYIIQRQETTSRGNFCLSCNWQLFRRQTLITLAGTWWGIIGFFLGPVYIFQNLYNYLAAVVVLSRKQG